LLQTGLVVKEQSGFFWVETEDGKVVICRLRGRLMEAAQSSDIAAIGDKVKISVLEDGTGSVEEVEPRTSVISRAVRTEGIRGAGSPEREQVIIANAEQAIFVFAAAQPAPNLRMLDRFLVAGEKSGIEKLYILINKCDLQDPSTTQLLFADYARIGYSLLFTSALRGDGIDELRELLKGRLSVFTGPSGVGKTSLLNTVSPGLGRAVKEVSRARQEGMHTTRDSQLVRLPEGGYLADTPGIRQLTIWDVEPEEVDAYYREIAPLVEECRFGDCTHRREPGCAVREAVERGTVSRARYQSYLSLRDELEQAYALH
jgi:ribosome biogenesis GTPase / thiamine phosphate phosphatase